MGDARRQELKAPSPDPPYGAPPANIPAGGECGRGRGGRFRGALTPHTMPYRVITECAFRCHAGPGPPVSRVGILRPPRPFSACGPSPPPCTVWLFFQDRLRQALRSRKPGVRRCVGFLNGSHVLSSRSSLCGALKRRCTRMGGSSRWTPPGPSPRRCLWPGTSSRPWARRTGWRRWPGPAAGPSTSRARPSTPASSTRTATPRCKPCGKRTAAVRASRTSRTCTP